MNSTNVPNLEALFNICANGLEIVGIRYGIVFIITAVLIAFLKQWKVARNYLLLGVGTTICGLAAPGFLNWIAASIHDANAEYLYGPFAILCVIFTFGVAIVSLGLLYLPVHIARKHQKQKLGWIIGLTAFSLLIPFLWSIAVFLAYKPDKAVANNSEANSAQV